MLHNSITLRRPRTTRGLRASLLFLFLFPIFSDPSDLGPRVIRLFSTTSAQRSFLPTACAEPAPPLSPPFPSSPPSLRTPSSPTSTTLASAKTPAGSEPALVQNVDATPPLATDAMPIFELVRSALRSWTLLPDAVPDDRMLQTRLRSISGVHVQLRLDHRLIGQGTSFSLSAPPTAEGCYALLRDAANAAMHQAESSFNLPNDALWQTNAREVGARLALSLDLAGPSTPMQADSWADAAVELTPGLTGVAVGLSPAPPAALFPSALAASNSPPTRGLSGLISQTLGEGGAAAALNDPITLRHKHHLSLYRFPSTHIAQFRAADPPIVLHRSSQAIFGHSFTLAEIRQLNDALADHLLIRLRPNASRPMLGVLRPWLADPEAAPASLAEESLALYALAHYSALPSADSKRRSSLGSSLVAAYSNLCQRLERERGDFDDDVAASLFVLADIAVRSSAVPGAPALPGPGRAIADARERVQSAYVLDKGFREDVPEPIRSAVVLALAGIASQTRAEGDVRLAQGAVRSLFVGTPRARLVMHMPFLAQAEALLADLDATPGAPRPDLPAAVALREMRADIIAHQLQPTSLTLSNHDYAGGIVFSSASGAFPSWQTARPFAYLTWALGDPRLTEPGVALSHLVDALKTLRFLRQLQVDAPAAWFCEHPAVAMGGVRSSLWDASLPPDAASFSLLGVTDFLRSAEALNADGSRPPPSKDPARVQPPKTP